MRPLSAPLSALHSGRTVLATSRRARPASGRTDLVCAGFQLESRRRLSRVSPSSPRLFRCASPIKRPQIRRWRARGGTGSVGEAGQRGGQARRGTTPPQCAPAAGRGCFRRSGCVHHFCLQICIERRCGRSRGERVMARRATNESVIRCHRYDGFVPRAPLCSHVRNP